MPDYPDNRKYGDPNQRTAQYHGTGREGWGVQVDCKGKSRQVLMPKKLTMKLMHYIKKEKIRSGPVFRTKQGNPIDRSNIWKEMKKYAAKQG